MAEEGPDPDARMRSLPWWFLALAVEAFLWVTWDFTWLATDEATGLIRVVFEVPRIISLPMLVFVPPVLWTIAAVKARSRRWTLWLRWVVAVDVLIRLVGIAVLAMTWGI